MWSLCMQPACCVSGLNFLVLQKKEDRGVTSLPAERPVRQEERGRDGRCRCRRADCCETQERPGHKHTGTRGNFAETSDGHNAAPPADPGADVTVHTQSREEAADTTNTSPRLPRLASSRCARQVGRSGLSVWWGTCPR